MVLTTGDLKNSVTRLRALLRTTRYPHAQAHVNGEFSVTDLLRILHYAVLDYSRHIAAFVLEKGYDLYGKTDIRFIDRCFRLMRDEFQYFPSVNPTQFLSNQFLERKIQLVADILDIVVQKHDECVRRKRQEQAVWTKPRELQTHSTHVENHIMPPPQTPATIDTWSLLEHLRLEARENARERKRAEALRLEQRRQAKYSNTVHSDGQPHSREERPRHSLSPSNQWTSAKEASDSNSDDALIESAEYQRPSPTAQNQQHEHIGCDCSSNKTEVHEVRCVDLGPTSPCRLRVLNSKQINDLTTAVLGRVSAIESRLTHVEEQLQNLTVAQSSTSRDALPGQRYVPISRTKAAFAAAASSSIETQASETRAQSAWPPDPDLLNLP